MSATVSSPAAQRFRDALGLTAAGIRLMRLNLERRHNDAPPEEIDERLAEWLLDGSPDCPGPPRSLPDV